MLTTEQLEARRTGIGGSDAAAAVGVSRWKSPLHVYREKRGEAAHFEGNEYTYWGQVLEPAIRQRYAELTGRTVRMPEGTLRHAGHRFMLCHPDGVTDDGRLLEIKNTRTGEGWGEQGSDEIPQEHLVQVQHNMMVMGLVVADVAVLVGGCDFRLFEVEADRELQAMLVEREAELWDRVQRGDPPPPVTAADVKLLYGKRSVPQSTVADEATMGAYRELASLTFHAKIVEKEIEALQTKVKIALGDNDTLVDPDGVELLTWRAYPGFYRIDGPALLKAFPEIHAQFTKQGEPYRRFVLKTGGPK